MTAFEVLEKQGIEKCRECWCPIGDDWKFRDFSNKTIIECPQCGNFIYLNYSTGKEII